MRRVKWHRYPGCGKEGESKTHADAKCVFLRLMQRDGTLRLHYFLHELQLRELNCSSAWPLSAVHPPLRGRREEGERERGLLCLSLYVLVCLTTRVHDGWWEIRRLLLGILRQRGLLAWSSPTVTSASPRCLEDAFLTSTLPPQSNNTRPALPPVWEIWFHLRAHKLCCQRPGRNVPTISQKLIWRRRFLQPPNGALEHA